MVYGGYKKKLYLVMTLTLPCDDPVAKDDIDCIVAAAGKQGWDAADEQKQGKPGKEIGEKSNKEQRWKKEKQSNKTKRREITNEEDGR